MIKKVVLLVEQYFTDRDYERYGIEKLIENDFNVEVWDLSIILWPTSVKSIKETSHLSTSNQVKRYVKMHDVLSDIHKENKETFFLSTLVYSFKTMPIFRYISSSGCNYGCSGAHTIGKLPIINSKKRVNRYSFTGYLNILLNKIVSLKMCINFLGVKPCVFFAINGGENASVSGPTIGRSTKIYHMHAPDYDLFLLKKNNKISTQHIVYIDQYLPYHPDWYSSFMKNSYNVDLFYSDLRAGFSRIEEITGFNVIIAAHPKANYHNKKELFGNREVIHGFNSFKLISHSKLVLMHYSTAINQAVLLEKPIIFLTSDYLNKTIAGDYTNNFAKLFNTVPLNMNQEFNDIKSFFADKNMYLEYKTKYIKKPGTRDVVIWQQIADIIKQY